MVKSQLKRLRKESIEVVRAFQKANNIPTFTEAHERYIKELKTKGVKSLNIRLFK